MTVPKFPLANARPATADGGLRLQDGSRIGVVGSGPAGSFFAYFLLDLSCRLGLNVSVDLYEARDFSQPAPRGCNMCGGIISESLVQNLAAEGIVLASDVIQRGIAGYVLHMDVGTVQIETPTREMRIGAVHRGSGPKDVVDQVWESFDGHLQAMALKKGARLIRGRVDEITRADGRPTIRARGQDPVTYDLLAVAVGVNSPTLRLFEGLGIGYHRPTVTKTLIREYRLGDEVISRTMGNAMHVFLLKIPRLEFAAIIPKGEYVTMCLLGEDIDKALVDAFVRSPEVVACMPAGWNPDQHACQCLPHINVGGAPACFADRFVFIGDCGVTRLYKDGIGAAYRTAKAAARTAVFEGIGARHFARYYKPVCATIAADNRAGRLAFMLIKVVQHSRILRRAMLRMAATEQTKPGPRRRLSGVFWDLFSGSAPYLDIFQRMLRPALVVVLALHVATSMARAMAAPERRGAPS